MMKLYLHSLVCLHGQRQLYLLPSVVVIKEMKVGVGIVHFRVDGLKRISLFVLKWLLFASLIFKH
jgi:hypothetical protein